MHYEDGTPAQLGDVVHVKLKPEATGGSEFIGILAGGIANSETCNGTLIVLGSRVRSAFGHSPWFKMDTPYHQCFTIKEGVKLL